MKRRPPHVRGPADFTGLSRSNWFTPSVSLSESEAGRCVQKIASLVDVLVGDEYAQESCLGIGGNAARSEATDAAPFDALVALASVELPNVRGFAATLLDPVLASVNRWSAVLWAGGQCLTASVREIAVLDRVGGGDGFVSGLDWAFIND